jgi:hypothetical protein
MPPAGGAAVPFTPDQVRQLQQADVQILAGRISTARGILLALLT